MQSGWAGLLCLLSCCSWAPFPVPGQLLRQATAAQLSGSPSSLICDLLQPQKMPNPQSPQPGLQLICDSCTDPGLAPKSGTRLLLADISRCVCPSSWPTEVLSTQQYLISAAESWAASAPPGHTHSPKVMSFPCLPDGASPRAECGSRGSQGSRRMQSAGQRTVLTWAPLLAPSVE